MCCIEQQHRSIIHLFGPFAFSRRNRFYWYFIGNFAGRFLWKFNLWMKIKHSFFFSIDSFFWCCWKWKFQGKFSISLSINKKNEGANEILILGLEHVCWNFQICAQSQSVYPWFYILLFHLLIEFADNKDCLYVCVGERTLVCMCKWARARQGWKGERLCVRYRTEAKATASYTLWIQIAISVAKENALFLRIRVWILTQSLFEI